MPNRNHIDLFTGIGGFSLAASWCGLKTVAMCEKDDRCRAFLEKAWPGVPITSDIRDFKGADHYGSFLLTAGVPCQPVSQAGKRRGAADERWLWPEALTVLADARPTWALFENPPGIGDVGLAGILDAMEALHYEVRVFGIPACAVGSPQRRERYWIVGHAQPGESRQTEVEAAGAGQGLAGARTAKRCTGNVPSNHAHGARAELTGSGVWDSFVWVPCADGKLRRAPDDSFRLVDGLHRTLLGALGNSIVPQVAAEIIGAMMEAGGSPEEEETE